MAQRTLDARGLQRSLLVENSGNANNRIQLQQRQRRGGIIEIALTFLQRLHKRRRKRIDIHFQPHRQRRCGTNSGTHTAKLCPFDRLMQMNRIASKRFIAERIKAKNFPATIGQAFRVIVSIVIRLRIFYL